MRGVALGGRARAPRAASSCATRTRSACATLVGRDAPAGGVQRAPRRVPPRRHDDEGEPRASAACRSSSACAERGSARPYGPTIHLLPDEHDVLASLEQSFADVQAPASSPSSRPSSGTSTRTVDPTMKDEHGHHNSALFVQWVPYALSGGKSWETEEDRYVKHLLSHLRPLRAGHERPRGRHVRAARRRRSSALRHHARAHPPRRQRASASPTACPTRRPSRASTRAAPARTPRAASSAAPATTRRCAC